MHLINLERKAGDVNSFMLVRSLYVNDPRPTRIVCLRFCCKTFNEGQTPFWFVLEGMIFIHGGDLVSKRDNFNPCYLYDTFANL